jgi:hypothetical protein
VIPELRPVLGWPGYGVAEDRTVWSSRKGAWRIVPSHVKEGMVWLWRDGRRFHRSMYRLWAETWGPDAIVPGKRPTGRVVGSAHGRARLDEAAVLYARRLHRAGWSERALATCFRCSPATMHYALVGRTWSHLPMMAED